MIALTRSQEGNQGLEKLLAMRGISSVQLPCVEIVEKNIPAHHFKECDIVVVTSAKGASMVGNSWLAHRRPKLPQVVSVGSQTSKKLAEFGLVSAFEPSCATAHHLGSELPKKFGVRVLYPTSNLADSTLEDTLTSRGFLVTRLNAYDTNSPIWNKDQLEQAKKVDIVAFFSPSAATSWAEKVGNDFIAVTFGPSTTAAAQKLNFREVRSCKTIELESLVDMLEECYHRAI